MEKETLTLRFTVEGSLVTRVAREWFWLEHKPWEKVEEFLFSCMYGTDMSEDELRKLALDVVMYRKKFIGNTGDETYELVEDKAEMTVVREIEELSRKYIETKKLLEDITRKHADIVEYLRENGYDYLIRHAENASSGWMEGEDESPELKSYIKQAMIEQSFDDNYGWLEPNGTFHPVDWGEHQDFARNMAIEKGWITEDDEICLWGGEGDRLTERGWILLHSPARGVPVVTVDPEKRITKAQRDFLYGYYTDRGLRNEAEKYLEV